MPVPPPSRGKQEQQAKPLSRPGHRAA
jgi:hypothetical protein